jgi:hypothetical protein
MLASLLADEAHLLTQIVRKQLPIDPSLLIDAFPELQQHKDVDVNKPSTTCSTNCKTGETPFCQDGTGCSAPTCECRKSNSRVLDRKKLYFTSGEQQKGRE